jgi:polyvinyl alcohol dehydrogenase (cytochrome)
MLCRWIGDGDDRRTDRLNGRNNDGAGVLDRTAAVRGMMMKLAAMLLATAALAGALPVLADDDAGKAKRPAPAVAVDREALPGAAAYKIVCAQCHDKAVYKAPSKAFLNMMSPDTIYASLAKGGLMQQQASALSDEQRRQVADYVGDASLAEALRAAQPPLCAKNQRAPDLRSPPRIFGWGADAENSHSIPASVARLPVAKIPRLKLKWAFAYPAAQRARSQPTVAMGTVFVGSQDGTVYALDARTGCVRWTFKATAEVRTPVVLSRADLPELRGRAPLAFFGDLTGRVYALDSRTGRLAWKATVEDHPATTMTGAPAYYDGRLYVSVSSLEEAAAVSGYECCTFRGSVVALDAVTGKQVWKRYMIDEAPAPSGTTTTGTRILGPSGAAVWNSPTIDTKRKVLYVGTGDNYSRPANDRSDAVVALDLETGTIRWTHQVVAGDVWNVGCVLGMDVCPTEPGPDFDIGAGTTLVHTMDGRDFIVAGLKSGHAIALDVDHPTKPVWTRRLGRGGIEGGIQFALAHDQDNLYVPISDMQVHDQTKPTEPQHPGLYALDPATGALRWSAVTENDHCAGKTDCDAGILSAVTVIPGAVFAGHMDGRIRAYEAATGKVLWEYDSTGDVKTTSGAIAHGGSVGGGGPMVVDGTVYVNSGYGIYWHMPGNLLLAFAADGK